MARSVITLFMLAAVQAKPSILPRSETIPDTSVPPIPLPRFGDSTDPVLLPRQSGTELVRDTAVAGETLLSAKNGTALSSNHPIRSLDSSVPSPTPYGSLRGQCCGLARRSTRIVGGVETEVREYPWQAGLVSAGDSWIWCGGTVINDRYVLTAAHCTVGRSADRLEVLLGEHAMFLADGERRVAVAAVTEHPRYRSVDTTGYDFSLLRLAQRLDFAALGGRVAPACLPAGGEFVGVEAIVSGWGTTSAGGPQPDALHEVTVRTQSNAQCSAAYRQVNPSMLCAAVSGGGKDACQGDSGGPLVTEVAGRYSLIGVVSWGIGCARPDYPGVYARVTAAADWIRLNTADASLC
ncbi:trypsin-1-like [Amphibalanus amphitrite]|uniref:trypsin-1-like n=1 Tax=Amphibalanus amphitrite TaxID=1232801 RepID=UPI001C908F6F|nr:trypsin-1-like [Amphibalanus amphitrite]